jgi:hypothetical protein
MEETQTPNFGNGGVVLFIILPKRAAVDTIPNVSKYSPPNAPGTMEKH